MLEQLRAEDGIPDVPWAPTIATKLKLMTPSD